MVIFLNGKFVTPSQAEISIFDHGFLYGDGVFERIRTYDGAIFNLKAHVGRLFRSAKHIGIHIPWSRNKVANWISLAVLKGGLKDSNIRVTLTRGLADQSMRYDFVTSRKPTICIVVTKFMAFPMEFYTHGINVMTFEREREFPEVKTISLLPQVLANREMHRRGARGIKFHEALFIDHNGHITEGTATNFYFVKNGVLIFPKARVLPGTTLDIVQKLVKRNRIQVSQKILTKKFLRRADECFVTSVTRGIMPVATIDGKKLRKKSPGPLTGKLMELFKIYARNNARK